METPRFSVDRLLEYWWVLLPILLFSKILGEGFRFLGDSSNINEDSAIFYISGRQWVEAGRVPYRELWDIKPPLTHEITAVIAFVTGGDPALIHFIGVVVNVISLLGAVLAIMLATRELTGSRSAGAISGLMILVSPFYFEWLLTGFLPKYPFLLSISMVFLLGVRERWVAAGAAAAFSACLWQPGLAVFIIALGTVWWQSYQEDISRKCRNRTVAAATSVPLAVVLPFILSGAGPEMFAQTVLAPLVTSDGGGGVTAILQSIQPWLVVFGGVGVFAHPALAKSEPADIWPALFLVAFGTLNLTSDLDGSPDLMPLALILAIGVGLLVGLADSTDNPIVSSIPLWSVIIAVFVVIWFIPSPTFQTVSPGPVARAFLQDTAQTQCHVRLSTSERQFIEYVGTSADANRCWRPDFI